MTNNQFVSETQINAKNVFNVYEFLRNNSDLDILDIMLGEEDHCLNYVLRLEKLGISVSFASGGYAEKNFDLEKFLSAIVDSGILWIGNEKYLTEACGFSLSQIAEKLRNYINSSPHLSEYLEDLKRYIDDEQY